MFLFLQALNVVFEKIPENESADVCRNIAVNVLDCDTIGQAKDKIFQAFLSKNGSPYGLQLNEIGLGKVSSRPLQCTPLPSFSWVTIMWPQCFLEGMSGDPRTSWLSFVLLDSSQEAPPFQDSIFKTLYL